eukprot:275491-Pelagomonas_calceolata.AAC.3
MHGACYVQGSNGGHVSKKCLPMILRARHSCVCVHGVGWLQAWNTPLLQLQPPHQYKDKQLSEALKELKGLKGEQSSWMKDKKNLETQPGILPRAMPHTFQFIFPTSSSYTMHANVFMGSGCRRLQRQRFRTPGAAALQIAKVHMQIGPTLQVDGLPRQLADIEATLAATRMQCTAHASHVVMQGTSRVSQVDRHQRRLADTEATLAAIRMQCTAHASHVDGPQRRLADAEATLAATRMQCSAHASHVIMYGTSHVSQVDRLQKRLADTEATLAAREQALKEGSKETSRLEA